MIPIIIKTNDSKYFYRNQIEKQLIEDHLFLKDIKKAEAETNLLTIFLLCADDYG